MRPNSITFKLLSLIVCAFIITTVSVLLVADRQLTRIIDESQEAVYAEKIESIRELLHRRNERLRQTGLVEAYFEDFKESSLKVLRQAYYNHADQPIYPFIIDINGKVVMYPTLPEGDLSLARTEFVERMLTADAGNFNYTYLGQKKWLTFKRFSQWNWVIAYTVPLDIKYADALEFRNLLMFTLGGISFFVLLALSVIVARFTKPITRLTKFSTAMAQGDLDQNIEFSGSDEVGILARSFSNMRDSIRGKISELEQENRERSRAEEKLVQKNEYINSILESLTHPFYAIDVHDYTIKIANSASGFNAGETNTCHRLTHGQDHPCQGDNHPCPLEIIKQTGKPVMVEHNHFDKNGVLQNFEVYAYPVFDRQGTLIQMIEYAIDVTGRRQAQADLAAEKERLSVTLRSIGDGVITTDISGKIVLLNRVAEDLTGWNTEEAAGLPLEEVFHIINEQTGEACKNPAAEVISGGRVVGSAAHTILLTKDGSKRRVADSGAPILDAKSNIIGVVLVFRDVTEQLKTEKELLKVKKLESIGILAGGIAHDFNNILAAILGNINLALFDQDLKEKTKRLLSEAEKASLRAKELTQQLLTFSKGGEPVKEVASLDDIIRDSADFILLGDKVACKYDIPEELWLVDIDKGQMSQVIQNIVLNAGHAMPEGGTISITCENLASAEGEVVPFAPDGRLVKITIRDSGIGMSANIAEKIFDPYFTTKHGGSGLGLAISQSIINKHNGHITVESTPDVGSTFTIYLPCSMETKTLKQESPMENKGSAPLRVLIMDDEEIVRDVVRQMLLQLGHEAVLSADGKEAVGAYKESLDSGHPFDLVIMDLTIPGGMGGAEAVQEILQLDPKAKVMVSSGYSNDPIMANCRQYGFCAAIVKPYHLQQLARIISQQL
ncbi:MAG: ATP-binding protein [Desulfobulbaceae bacterium]|nr:ATP-binding protein [Desulfobulbaceae bacterium]